MDFTIRNSGRYTALAVLMTCVAPVFAWADEPSKDGIPSPSIAASLPDKGDPYGVRADLAAKGVTYGLNYIGEILGNATGGSRQGAIYQGRLEGVLDADLEKLWGISGLTFHTNVYQIHGSGLADKDLQNLLVPSSIEALPSTRFYEIWFEQKINSVASLRFGQLAADTEFFITVNGANFVNSTFGWPGIAAADLPSGGPAYPLATPGVRLKLESPGGNYTFLAAVFNGDPAGPGDDNPQHRNRYGTSFRVNDDAFFIAEGQYKYNQGKTAAGLPGTIKAGGWGHTGEFSDQRLDGDGVSLALGGSPRQISGNYGFYGIIDQQIYRLPGGGADNGVNVFARLSGSPSDRNLVDLYADGGFVFSGFVPKRPDDSFGIGFAYASISSRASDLDRDVNFYNGSTLPVRNYEAALEIYYKAQIIPGFVVQPDFQYIWNPGGNVAGSNGKPVDDAFVGGVRVSVNY